ncbi:MAG: sulfatase-like hydrolase/transferase, partial [Planctomycetota bacterium]|nr:sulfatase-like hydrolase/transferase [Planctomycetota bacterium]
AVRLALPAVKARAWGQAAVLALAGVGAGMATYPLLWGSLARLELGQLPLAVKNPDCIALTGLGLSALTGLVLAAGAWIARAGWVQNHPLSASAEDRVSECLRRISRREILAGLPGAGLSGLTACLAICLPISFLGLLNMTGSIGIFLATLLLTGCCIAVLSVVVCLALHVVWLTWVSAVRASGAAGKTSVLIGVLSTAMLFGLLRWGLSLAFSGEMRRLGLDWLIDAILLVGAMFYGLGVARNLPVLSAEAGPQNAGQFIRLCILAGALLPVLPVVRMRRGHVRLNRRLILAGCLVLGVLAVVLSLPFFQKLDDHFSRINVTLAVLILVVTVLLGLAAAPPHPRAWPGKLLALAAVAVPCTLVVATSAYAMANSRAEMNIYSPIGKATAQLLGPLLPMPAESQADAGGASLLGPASAPRREAVLDNLKSARPLVVLILWDACRPDHMSLFGYQRKASPLLPTTPNLDANKDQFLRFTNCFSHGTGTTCSMRQMLTSRYSSRWMLRTKGVDPFWLNDLAANGYDAFFLNIIGSDYNGISLDAFHRDMPADMKTRLECLACASCPASAREKLRGKEKNVRTDYVDLPKASPQRLAGL